MKQVEMAEVLSEGNGSSSRVESNPKENIKRKASPDTWQRAANSEELAKSFELWYANTRAASEQIKDPEENEDGTGKEGSAEHWGDTPEDFKFEPDPSDDPDELTDEPWNTLADPLQATLPIEDEVPYIALYNFEHKPRDPLMKFNSPKWPLSVPPQLAHFEDKYKGKKFPARRPARKQHLGWGSKTSSWENTTESWAEPWGDESCYQLSAKAFEISYSEPSWLEMQSLNMDSEFRRYRPYTRRF